MEVDYLGKGGMGVEYLGKGGMGVGGAGAEYNSKGRKQRERGVEYLGGYSTRGEQTGGSVQ